MELLKILDEEKNIKLDKLYSISTSYYLILSVLYLIFWVVITIFNPNILGIIVIALFTLITIINSSIVINVKLSNKRKFLFIPLITILGTMLFDIYYKNLVPIFTYYLPMITLIIQLYLLKGTSYKSISYQKILRGYYIFISLILKFGLLSFMLYYIGYYLFNNAINIINPLSWYVPFYSLLKTPLFWTLCFYVLIFALLSDIFSKSITWFVGKEDLEYSLGYYEEQYKAMTYLFSTVTTTVLKTTITTIILILPVYAILLKLQLLIINKILFAIGAIMVIIDFIQNLITLVLSFIPTIKYIVSYEEAFKFENYATNAALTKLFELAFNIIVLIYLYRIIFQ